MDGIVLIAIVARSPLSCSGSTRSGHRFVVDPDQRDRDGSGLKIHVGRIEGSIFGRADPPRPPLADPKGTFFTAPGRGRLSAASPIFRNHIDIRDLDIPRRG
jgi:translocation and assembly module TamB